MAKVKAKTSADTAANLGFEAKRWLTADKFRNNMDAAEYKHVEGNVGPVYAAKPEAAIKTNLKGLGYGS